MLRICVLAMVITGVFVTAALADSEPMAGIEKMFLEQRYDKVVSESSSLIESKSYRREPVYYLRGLSLLKLKRFKEAREDFQYIISRFPGSRKSFDVYIGIGDSYLLEGDPGAAVKIYDDVVRRYPDNKNISLAYYRLAESYAALGANDKSADYFNKAKKISPLSFESKMPPALGAPKTALKRETAPTQPSGKNYSVQVGYFKSRKNAEKVVKALSAKGYDSYVEESISGSDKFYRAKAGKYGSEEDAQSAASRLTRSGYSTKICMDDVCLD